MQGNRQSNATTTPSTQVAVSCRGVVKEFGSGQTRIRVLRGVDMDANFGEITFLVGPSGCGKTTLISVLAGLLTPNAGEVDVLGQRLGKLRGGKLVNFRAQNLGFIFQQFNLIPTLTAVENASVSLVAQGVGLGKAVKLAGEMFDRLGLGDQRNKYPNQLSGGQQQRVAIARALVHEPRLVICDEPTASLDAATGRSVMLMLKELALASTRAVIVVTHDDRIYSFADRINHMSDGLITDVTTQISESIAPVQPVVQTVNQESKSE